MKRSLSPSSGPRFQRPMLPRPTAFSLGDVFILLVLLSLLYAAVRLALRVPKVIARPEISLARSALPWYALTSTARMVLAYILSLIFSLGYSYLAARRRKAGKVLIPLLDVLQSVPILSFLPLVLLTLSAILPQSLAAEISAITLIFTSQAWNLTFSFYQSLTTIPEELREAASVFLFDPWLKFKTLALPFAAKGLVWNSMVSWAGGWFFLMASETFTVGARDFRLPGLGAYLQTAADRGDLGAVAWGLAALIITICVLDQVLWRPLLVWADKFKVEAVEGEAPPRSWIFNLLSRSWLLEKFLTRVWSPLSEGLDSMLHKRFAARAASQAKPPRGGLAFLLLVMALAGAVPAAYGITGAASLLLRLEPVAWARVGTGIAVTFLRVAVSLFIALLWTVPVGVMIGMNQRLTARLQPVVQVVASIPATALFPVILLGLIHLPAGLDFAAVLLMLMGTQWYILFNVIAGAAAIPQDLRYTSKMLGLSRWDHFRTLILPALFPYIVTGSVTATGGAWNASIVAEHVEFAGSTRQTLGIGALIREATSNGDYGLLVAATLLLAVTVVFLNRLFWLKLYRLAEERFKLE